jgi:hypothetical protein
MKQFQGSFYIASISLKFMAYNETNNIEIPMMKIGHFDYKEYQTDILMTDEVKNFLVSKKVDLELHKEFRSSEDFYETLMLEVLCDGFNADPNPEYGEYFQLIYCSVMQKHDELLNKAELAEIFGFHEEVVMYSGLVSKTEATPPFGIQYFIKQSGKPVISESGEIIHDHIIKDIANQIRKLPLEKIDEFWFKCGWICSWIGKNKALDQETLEGIKNDQKKAENQVLWLLEESRIKDVQDALKEIIKDE